MVARIVAFSRPVADIDGHFGAAISARSVFSLRAKRTAARALWGFGRPVAGSRPVEGAIGAAIVTALTVCNVGAHLFWQANARITTTAATVLVVSMQF